MQYKTRQDKYREKWGGQGAREKGRGELTLSPPDKRQEQPNTTHTTHHDNNPRNEIKMT